VLSISHRPVPRRRRGSAVGAALLSAVLLTVLGAQAQAQAQADVPEKAAKPSSSTREPPGHVAPLCGPAKDSTASRGWSESVWSHDAGGTGWPAKADHRRR
jgi:hypothetical protein